jgi:two-component system, sensor histidine kinase and response regulator
VSHAKLSIIFLVIVPGRGIFGSESASNQPASGISFPSIGNTPLLYSAINIIQNDVHAYADPRLIHIALENLLRNAWKFTSKTEAPLIEFGTTILQKGETVYFVRDNGVGFDMKFAMSIFEPFRRTHADKEFGGTGVGLSIVQRVIYRHGGKVWALGEVGKGASFFFTLKTR